MRIIKKAWVLVNCWRTVAKKLDRNNEPKPEKSDLFGKRPVDFVFIIIFTYVVIFGLMAVLFSGHNDLLIINIIMCASILLSILLGFIYVYSWLKLEFPDKRRLVDNNSIRIGKGKTFIGLFEIILAVVSSGVILLLISKIGMIAIILANFSGILLILMCLHIGRNA